MPRPPNVAPIRRLIAGARSGLWCFLRHCGVLLFGLLPVLVAAQQLSLRYLTTSDGLANMVVTALVQETGGTLWIGTENGLYRHDGETIHHVDDGAPQSIYSMVFGSDGTLWVTSRTGLYRRSAGKFSAVSVGDAAWSVRRGQALAALPDGSVLVVGIEGKLWRVTANGEDARLEHAFPATLEPSAGPHTLEARSILVARSGAWWFGCGDALCSWHAGKFEHWDTPTGVPHGEWLGLLEARDGSIWARSDHYAIRRTANATRFTNVTPQGLSKGGTHRWLPLHEDLAGRILTAGDDGVFRWQAGRWQYFGEQHGLTEEGLRAILPDRDGDIWLGTVGHGLLHWRGYGNWTSWTIRQGLPSDAVWSIADDGAGRVWVGTTRGVVSTHHGGTELVRDAPAANVQIGHLVADGGGGMWSATFDGKLFHRNRGAPWRVMNAGKRSGVGRLLAVQSELWVTTVDGLFTAPLDGSGPLRRRDALDSLLTGSDRRVNTACREMDSGAVWLGTGSGLLRFDPARGFLRPQIEGLAQNSGVVYLACGAGRVWLRTAIGRQLMRIDLARTGVLRAVPEQPAVLNGRHILSLLEDRRGWLWAGTDLGVVRWNGENWRRFDESNGLAWNDCNQNALAEDAQGAIWVGTSRGVTRIDDPEGLRASVPMALKLSEAQLGSFDLLPGPAMAVPWSTQPLELRWEVPLFTNRQAQRTRYRLRGRDDDWTEISHSELRYAGLGAGHYSLELMAVNDDLGQASQPMVLDFEIAPPWWQSPPVLAAALAVALLLVYAGYRVHIRRLVRRQTELEAQMQERTRDLAERKRMALRLEESQLLLRQLAARNEETREDERRHVKREIHDELGQYLSALRLGLSIVDMQLGKLDSPLQARTQHLIAVADSTIQVARNVVAALRPTALDLGIVSALEWLAQMHFERSGVPCELQVLEDEMDMDDKSATAVFRIVQESLTNILRHAQATQVWISLVHKEGQYFLEVRDNGRGFDVSVRKEGSFGLIGIRERALMLGGEIDLFSVPGRTVLRVRFPVQAFSEPVVGVS